MCNGEWLVHHEDDGDEERWVDSNFGDDEQELVGDGDEGIRVVFVC